MTKTDVICPYCEQDRVWRVALGDSETEVYPHAFCYECDTFWDNGTIIDDKTGKTFKSYMEQRGRKLDYEMIKQGPAAEPKNAETSEDEIKGNRWRAWNDAGKVYFEYDAGHFATKMNTVEITEGDFGLLKLGKLTDKDLINKYG